MTTAQVVETSVTVNNNSPIQDYVHPDDQTQPTFEMTPGFKPFTIKLTSDAKIQLVFTDREGSWLCLAWSRSTSEFSSPIGQNLTVELLWNIYAASDILFTSLHDSRFMSQARRGEVCVIELR